MTNVKTIGSGTGTHNRDNDSFAESHLLMNATETRSLITKQKQLTMADRKVFAENLYRLFAQLQSKVPTTSFSSILVASFGEKTGESFAKKRKTFFLRPGENANKSGLRSKANFYLAIGDEIYRRLEPKEDSSRIEDIVTLRIIEGSSFDYQGSIRDKLTDGYTRDLKAVLQKITQDTLRSTNLEWAREWSVDHYVSTEGETGLLDSLGLGGFYCLDFDLFHRRSERFEAQSNCCPCVPICFIRLPLKPLDGIYLESTKTGQIPVESMIDDYLDKHGLVSKHDSLAAKLDVIPEELWSEEDNDLHGLFRIDLELRFNRTLYQWEPVVLYRQVLDEDQNPVDQPTGSNKSIITRGMYLPDNTQFLGGWEAYSDYAYYLFSIRGSESVSANKSVFRVVRVNTIELDGPWNYFSYAPFAISTIANGIRPPETDEPDLLLNEELDISDVLLERPANSFVDLPSGSVGALLMKNYLYAEEAARIDNLLITDAKAKIQKIQGYGSVKGQKYRDDLAERLGDKPSAEA